MKRTPKFVLSTLVLAGMIGGTAAWAATGTEVNLKVDGKVRHERTAARTVGQALAEFGIGVSEHDLVVPDASTRLTDGTTIVVRHAHEVRLVIDGESRSLWVQADSVGDMLDQLGYGQANAVSVSRDTRLADGLGTVSVSTPKAITVKVDGRTIHVISAGPTVADAVEDAGVALSPADRTSAPRTSTIGRNQTITVQRVTFKEKTEVVTVAPQVVRQNDANAWAGIETVVANGTSGRSKVTFQLVYVDGKYTGRTVKTSVVLKASKPKVITVGTKPVPWLDGLAADDPHAIAGAMLLERGWGADQYSCLDSLWTKESGWRTDAYNPSGAYGIPQSLPGSKMASFGADWETSARTQIAWGLSYISSVYGTPCSAWGHSQATDWY